MQYTLNYSGTRFLFKSKLPNVLVDSVLTSLLFQNFSLVTGVMYVHKLTFVLKFLHLCNKLWLG